MSARLSKHNIAQYPNSTLYFLVSLIFSQIAAFRASLNVYQAKRRFCRQIGIFSELLGLRWIQPCFTTFYSCCRNPAQIKLFKKGNKKVLTVLSSLQIGCQKRKNKPTIEMSHKDTRKTRQQISNKSFLIPLGRNKISRKTFLSQVKAFRQK